VLIPKSLLTTSLETSHHKNCSCICVGVVVNILKLKELNVQYPEVIIPQVIRKLLNFQYTFCFAQSLCTQNWSHATPIHNMQRELQQLPSLPVGSRNGPKAVHIQSPLLSWTESNWMELKWADETQCGKWII
jgi:hypothetical protein